jgi:hypothetical protein
VQHLLDPPTALLAPAIAARVLGARRPAPATAGARPAPV